MNDDKEVLRNVPNYPSNSYKARTEVLRSVNEIKKVEKITTAKVVTKKKTPWDKFKNTFFGEGLNDIGKWLFHEVLVPSFKDIARETVFRTTDRALGGNGHYKDRDRDRKRDRDRASYTQYDKYSDRDRDRGRGQYRDRDYQDYDRKASHDFDDITIPYEDDAERVLDHLIELVEKFDAATVADFYQMVGIVDTPPDRHWGWMNLKGSYVCRTRGGEYCIILPKPIPLER